VRVLGEDFDETNTLARRFAELEGGTFLPPFDHARVIEGQGTAVRELLLAVPSIDALVLPCGGGGLVAGAVLAARELGRDVRIVAVEPVGLPSLGRALDHGRPIKLAAGHTLADGIAVREVGRLPLRVMRRHLAGVVTVTEPQLLHAIRFLALEAKQIVEGAGAAATAALLGRSSGLEEMLGDRRNVGVLLSGGNLDPAVLCRALGSTAEAA
jgi:threonine dehydratase